MALFRMTRVEEADVDGLGLAAIDLSRFDALRDAAKLLRVLDQRAAQHAPENKSGGDIGLDEYQCSSCDFVLVKGARPGQAETMVLRCPKCRTWSWVTSTATP